MSNYKSGMTTLNRCLLPAILFCTLVGCQPYPRYTSSKEKRTRIAVQDSTGRTTNDNLRLGLIVQSYLGKPYTGRSKYVDGVDCSFFVSEVFRKFDQRQMPRTVAEQYQLGKVITRKNLAYGDLVYFKTERSKVSHVGIYIGENQFIHASTSRGVIITDMSEKYWSKRYVGSRRIR